MQVAFKTYFLQCNDSSMCQVYSTKEKVDLFFGESFEYIMIFML
jgi:hypothetical protein